MNEDINSKIISTILFWTYFVIGLLTEAFILWLFPNTGLGGLICWPTSLFFSLIFAFGLLRIHKKFKRRLVTVICFVAFLSIQVFSQLLLTPQEYGGEPIDQISEAISTYKRFDKIDFSDFSKLNQFERASYIFKNKNTIIQVCESFGLTTNAETKGDRLYAYNLFIAEQMSALPYDNNVKSNFAYRIMYVVELYNRLSQGENYNEILNSYKQNWKKAFIKDGMEILKNLKIIK